MKKLIIWVFAIIVILVIVFGALYIIDMNKMKNNKPVIFSTWGYDYCLPAGIPSENCKIKLTLIAIRDMVIAKGDKLTWSDFEQYKSIDVGSGLYILSYDIDENYRLMIGGVPTVEPMYIRLISQKNNEQYIDIRYENIEEFLNKTNYINYEPQGESSFIGTVLEETTTYMIVEPNEDEDERKSADKIRINYGVDHIDYLYGVGRKVLITYSGYIMETYPAQINTNNVSAEGYLDFNLSFVKQEENVKSLSGVVNLKKIDKYGQDIAIIIYDLKEVNVSIEGIGIYSLKDALLSGKITKNGLIRKATVDNDNGLNRKEIYKDGGSILWAYDDYTILKMNTLDGDNDIYIGASDMTINGVNERKIDQKIKSSINVQFDK